MRVLTHTCTRVPMGQVRCPQSSQPRTRTLSLTFVSTQTLAHSNCQYSRLGAGQVPFRRRDSAPLPAPWGLLQMPGVILSLDQWMSSVDTGLEGRAEETRGKGSRASLWRETLGLGRAAWAKGSLSSWAALCLDPPARHVAGYLGTVSAD